VPPKVLKILLEKSLPTTCNSDLVTCKYRACH